MVTQGPMLDLILCCHHCEILPHFIPAGPREFCGSRRAGGGLAFLQSRHRQGQQEAGAPECWECPHPPTLPVSEGRIAVTVQDLLPSSWKLVDSMRLTWLAASVGWSKGQRGLEK